MGIILILNINHVSVYLSEPLIQKLCFFFFFSLSLCFSSTGITFFSNLSSAVISDQNDFTLQKRNYVLTTQV